jgi:solute carrier family 25 aspartate/glutamate transporter 12/13
MSSKIVVAADAMKETLLGTTVVPELSQQARKTFEQYSRKEGEEGEPYMLEDDFVHAIAPDAEDYVSIAAIGTFL